MSESSGTTEITVTAQVATTDTLTAPTDIRVSVFGGTITPPQPGRARGFYLDFATVTPFTISLAAGATSAAATFDLIVTDDTASEGPETILIQGSGASRTVTQAWLTINDNDKPPAQSAAGCTNGTHVTNPSANTGLVADCQNLIAARNHWTNHNANVNLAHNHNLRTWTANITTWPGITVDATANRVTELNLPSKGIGGTMPTQLGNLANLTQLRLDDNQLTGAIPTQLGNLTNLRWLRLDDNQLTGAIPTQLGNLTNLEDMYLNNNRLTGAIPTQLGNLTNLANLYLRTNRLTGAIPAQLGNLTNLTNLWLYNNRLSGGIPKELGDLRNLTSLGLHNNYLTGGIPAQLGNLRNLTDLGLNHNQLSGGIPAQFGNLRNLTHLYLHNNYLTGEIPVYLGYLGNLTRLWLHNNYLTGGIPAQLGNLRNLTHLYLSNNYLTGEIPTELGSLSALTSFWFCRNYLTGALPAALRTGVTLDFTPMIETCRRTPAAVVALSTSPAYVLESSGTTRITLTAETLTSPTTVTVSVTGGTSSGQATAGADFTAVSDFTITIANGATSATVSFDITVTDDNAPEGAETITVSGASTAYWVNSITPATLTIHDGDIPPMDSAGCTNGTHVTDPATNTGLAADCQNLIAARNHWTTDHDDNTNLAADHKLRTWTGDITTWPGITVDATANRVTALDLHNPDPANANQQIGGTIPAQLGNLANLTTLSLNGNQLTGTIPAQLGNLTNLTTLHLNDNRLTGEIPTELGSLSSLTSFSFCQNYLTGALPIQLRTGVTLDFTPGDYTDIRTCRRTRAAVALSARPAYVSESSGTTTITVTALVGTAETLAGPTAVTVSVTGGTSSGQATAGADFTAVSDFTITIADGATSATGTFDITVTDDNTPESAETITVSGASTAYWVNSITPATLTIYETTSIPPMDSAGCTNGTHVTDPATNTGLAADCQNLIAARNHWTTDHDDNTNLAADHKLRTWTGDITTWPGITVDATANRVTALDLHNPDPANANQQIGGTIPAQLGNLANLTTLHLNGNQLTGEIPAQLGNLTNLTTLHLNDNRLTGEIPTELGSLSSLTSFSFCQNYLTGALPIQLRTGVTLDFTPGDYTDIRTCRRSSPLPPPGPQPPGPQPPGPDKPADPDKPAEPDKPADPDFFDDDNGSSHEAAINALAQAGITRGCEPRRFCPNRRITRAQIATLVYRSAARQTGESAPYAGRVDLTDVPAWWNAAQWAASTRIVSPTPDGEFNPTGAVTRADAAVMLVAALEHLGLAGVDLSGEPQNLFTDVEGLPDTTVNAMETLYRLRITLGCAAEPLRFCPDQPLTRAQAATLLARTLGLIPTT